VILDDARMQQTHIRSLVQGLQDKEAENSSKDSIFTGRGREKQNLHIKIYKARLEHLRSARLTQHDQIVNFETCEGFKW
jgi:hypothetical protein